MKKRNMLENVRNKALITAAAIAVSGLLPAGAVFAQGEIVAEVVADQAAAITGKPGETVIVPVDIRIAPFGKDNSTAAVTVTAKFEGNSAQQVSFAANDFTTVRRVNLEYTIPATETAAEVTKQILLSSTDSSGNDKVVDDVDDWVTIKVARQAADTTAPVVTAIPSRTPDAGGWYNKDVSVSFSAADEAGGSGVDQASVSGPVTITAEGTHSVTGTAKDLAGNEGSVSTVIRLDKTAPSLTSATDIEPNTAGWYKENVTVSFTGTDDLSGIDSVSGPIFLTEGASQTAEGTAADKAGNIASLKVEGLNIDTTAPVVNAVPDREANANGWYNDDVAIEFTAADNLSGIASVTAPIHLTEERMHTVSGSATDIAGHTSSGNFNFSIDKTAPTIGYSLSGQPNGNGWFNQNITVSFSAEDSLSGIASVSDPITLTEGEDQAVSGSAADKADNTATVTTASLNVDTTNPEIAVPADLAFTLNETAAWSASDALSGLSSAAGGTFDTSKPGTHTVTVTAEDQAGNSVEKEVTYTVSYSFGGVLDPISTESTSIFKSGRTVPVKFQLQDVNGAYVTNAVASIRIVKTSNSVMGEEVDAVSTSAATSGNLFRYDPTDNQYIFNLSTKGLSSGTYSLVIYLNDGTKQVVNIGIK
ncbi:PxKF domain-containing protein [Indiicoccus explosivorum]|uniref:PxKF domain-containing protein n=1 Tax=Indiicoccus explosivorum TaxID=1917864 RepID=UPI000B43C1AA|nr:PxKF domain-containing protein [Indiicoccus explosivorum]